MESLRAHLRNTFLTGVVVAIPLVATALVIFYAEFYTRAPLKAVGFDYPGLGIVLAIGTLYLVGLFVSSLVGRFIVWLVDTSLIRVPVLKNLYHAWKQISFTPAGGKGIFTKVVLVPDGTGQLFWLGFSSGEPAATDTELCCVFIPQAPNPLVGRVAFVRQSDLVVLDLSVYEGFKMLISSGNYKPLALGAPVLPVIRA